MDWPDIINNKTVSLRNVFEVWLTHSEVQITFLVVGSFGANLVIFERITLFQFVKQGKIRERLKDIFPFSFFKLGE